MKNKYVLWASALLLSLMQTSASAEIYKWVDEDGQVHYGEKPGNSTAKSVTIRENETTTPRVIKKIEKTGEKKIDAKPTDQTGEKPAGSAETPPAEAPPVEAPLVPEKIPRKEKNKLCNEAKSDYAAISGRGRMREINEKGEYIYLDEAQRQKRIDAARKKQREYCR